tara:strand:+ start:2000 stop:2278 length:279 start_codon:yes stop_codon:yes gene_type:complete
VLLHIGENNYLDKDEILMILNPKAIYKKESQTSLHNHKELQHSSKRTKSQIIVDSNVVHHSTVDSLTLYKRDEVLRFMDSDAAAKHSGGKNE